jgi:hypothetical protein
MCYKTFIFPPYSNTLGNFCILLSFEKVHGKKGNKNIVGIHVLKN